MGRIGTRLKGLARAFSRAHGGNVAMMTGVALPVLLMGAAGAIDLHNMVRVRSELQDALDAAALAAARSPFADQGNIQRVGMDALRANMPEYFINNPGDVATFSLTGRSQVTATATVQVKTIVANIILPPYGKLFDDHMPMNATSEVLRASRNVEVAMALDITGSMASYMGDLKSAATELVNIVIQNDQDIYTTRVALAPYAAGVNAGGLANTLRGPLTGRQTITRMDWKGRDLNITRIRNGVFEVTNHGLSNGDWVYFSGLSGDASTLNGRTRQVRSVSGSGFSVDGFSRNGTINWGTSVVSCLYENCHVGVTVPGNIVETGDYVSISSARNMSNMNRSNLTATVIADDQFTVDFLGINAGGTVGTGILTCHGDGCSDRRFVNRSGSIKALDVSTCVSERPRGNTAPSDRAPASGSWLGRVAVGTDNTCPDATYFPLTDDASALRASINSYRAAGSTAGQVGIEMAWYSVSPTFGSVFGSSSRPNPFDTSQTIKAVVLMTDGEFNTPFCKGVIARDAGTGSGSDSNKINCNATNGDGFEQSVAICSAMRAQGIVVYTVGFNLGSSRGWPGIDTAYEVMENCATSNEHFFPAATGTDLREAFKSIGRDITRLRIAR